MADHKETIARLRAEKKRLQADLKAARAGGASKSTRVGIKDKKSQVKSEIAARRNVNKAKRQNERAVKRETRRQSR